MPSLPDITEISDEEISEIIRGSSPEERQVYDDFQPYRQYLFAHKELLETCITDYIGTQPEVLALEECDRFYFDLITDRITRAMEVRQALDDDEGNDELKQDLAKYQQQARALLAMVSVADPECSDEMLFLAETLYTQLDSTSLTAGEGLTEDEMLRSDKIDPEDYSNEITLLQDKLIAKQLQWAQENNNPFIPLAVGECLFTGHLAATEEQPSAAVDRAIKFGMMGFPSNISIITTAVAHSYGIASEWLEQPSGSRFSRAPLSFNAFDTELEDYMDDLIVRLGMQYEHDENAFLSIAAELESVYEAAGLPPSQIKEIVQLTLAEGIIKDALEKVDPLTCSDAQLTELADRLDHFLPSVTDDVVPRFANSEEQLRAELCARLLKRIEIMPREDIKDELFNQAAMATDKTVVAPTIAAKILDNRRKGISEENTISLDDLFRGEESLYDACVDALILQAHLAGDDVQALVEDIADTSTANAKWSTNDPDFDETAHRDAVLKQLQERVPSLKESSSAQEYRSSFRELRDKLGGDAKQANAEASAEKPKLK